ncbi:MAG TPA: DUF2076 domain-containing protein [Xanthobacteraceae bacterium]|jgi:hypothetical protein|nr:DUF2076 domain-containing protein [Xanthobacteraceae bacterium]
MTPQEQQLVADLFDRLASLEGQRRDPDAERLIREGLGRAPNAVYALVQSVLVQDEALKRANARIEELERAIAAAPAESGGGFLDSMRKAILGREQPRASVPSVRPGGMGASGVWGSAPGPSQPQASPPGYQPQGYPQGYQQGYPQGYPQPGYPMGAPMGGGGSFLGTAAATVAGVVGGAMLLDGIRSMMGGHHGFAGDYDHGGGMAHAAASPWDSGGDHGSGNLAHDAGLDDIGGGHRAAAYDDSSGSGVVSDDAGDEAYDQPDDDYDAGDDAGDMGDGGDYDTA